MAGEDFFKFNKGNEFRFSNFREIKEEDLKGADEKTKKLFNIFAGEDKILQEVEAKSLFNVLKSAAGDNQVLEDNEIKSFAKEHIGEEVDTNILATFVNNIFGTKEKPQTQAMQVAKDYAAQKQQTFLEEAACKEIVIDIIDENLSEAYEILNSQYLGSISGWHDERKDKNDILKTSNVSKVLDYQNAGIEWMNKAKLAPPNGLTKKEYYEGNKQRIKDMILTRVLVLDTNTKFKELKNKYSEEKLAEIIGDYVEQLCSNASIEDLKDIQKRFVSYSGVEEIQALENVIDNAIKFNADKNKPMPYSEVPLPKFDKSKGIVPEYWNSDEPISFEEVYKIERGTEYSQYKIEQYALAKKEMEVVANAYNKKQQFIEFTEGLRKDETLNIDEKIQKVLEGFATFYALAEDGGLSQLKELIAESKLPVSIDENGFNFGTLDDNAKNRALNSLLKLAQQSKEKEFEEFLNGKTIEDYQIALAQAHDDAIGEENGKLMAEAMKNDNLTCIQRWTGNTSMAGMGMTIVGGILCFTPLAPLGAGMITVGNTLAIGGMVAKTGLGVTDYATKDVQTAEEAEQLTKDFIMDAGGFIIGMGAGKAGLKAFSKLIDKKLVAVFGQQIASGNKMQALKTVFTNPEYLKNFMTAAGAKLSADFVISYAGDLAMMGILDTQDDWQSLLKANLTGILVGMSGDIKDVSGVGRPRNFGVSDGVRPMTEMDYGQRLLGNDVTVADPKTGTTVKGTVTGLHNTNGQVEIEVNGQRYSTNDVAEVKGEVKVEVETPKVEISLGQRLETASSREEFVAIRDEIKAMPMGAEKTALQQEYLKKYNEFSRKYNEEFDIRMEYKPDKISIKVQSLSEIIQDKELLEIKLKELFGMSENEKLHDMYDFQIKELVSIIDKENIVLLESILKRNDIQTWDVQDLLKSCCNNSEKANKLKYLLSLKRQEENVFKAYTCTTLVENDYDEALLNKMLLKEVNGNYKYDGDYISQALQLCTGSKEKTWAMNQIIEKDLNIYSYNLNEWLSLISPENMGIILYLKEIKLNDFDLQECLKFCKSTEEQLPKLQEINTRIDISGPQKLEMIKNSLKNSELTELLYKDSRFLEDSWTTTAIISKYDSAKEMVDFLLRQKNIDNPEFLKYNPSEILDFINSSLTISDLTPATLKMIDDIKALKFEGEQLFSKPVTFIETLKNNKEYEFIWTDILQNIKNGNLQLENGIFVKNIIENFKNIPENYQTKILNLFLGENKKLSVYNLSNIISANQKDNIFNNPFKLKVFDDLLTRIQKEDFENIKDLNCIDELLSSILGPTQVNWYLKLIEFNQKNNSRFSLNDINEIIKKCHSIDEESFDRFVNYKETDGITPRFTGSEISNLLNYSGFWLNKFETVAGLKNSDGTYKFNGEAIYALLRLGDRTKESGIYDKLLSIEVEGKAKFQGKSCEDLLNLTFQLRKDARELLLDLMENQNISEKVLLKIFEADYPGGPILVKDIPWEEFAKYGLLENSNGEVNHKLIQTLKYYWSGDTSYVEKMMSMISLSLETMNYMKNISKEGLNEVSWYKQILEKADKMTDAEIKFYFDFGKQAIYDNYHGRWSELNDNKINVTNNFLSSLLDSKTVLTLDSFSISEKITLLNYLKDINIADFKSPNSFSSFLQKFSSTDELKRHIMKDLEVSLKQPGKDIIISQGHINKLLKGEFSGLKEKYPFITNDVIAKYNKIMLKTNNLEGLTSKDQVVLKFAVLFEKINGDETLNSIIARNILENNGMTADISERVFNLLKNKNWLTMYKEGKLDINDIAVLFREPNDLEIAKLLCAEDFLNETNRSIIKEVETTLNNIYSTAPIVKPTTIPYEQRYLTRLLYEDTEYKIIDFTDPNLNLSALGFSKELNSENIRFLTHFINIEGQDSRMSGSSTELINLLCDEMNNTSLSVALINPNHIDIDVMGRNCAVILEPMGSNYAAAFHEDFTSPLKKGFQEFKEYLTGKLTPEKRVYISNVYKKLLNLNDSEYVEFYKAISGLKDISNIKADITINKGLSTERVIPKEEVISAINSAHNSLTNVTGNWNELIIYNPKIKALLYKIETDVQDNLLENCPKDILDFAKKHNVPIVITK